MLHTLSASLLSYVGTNATQAIEMVLDSQANSEDSFVSYLQEEFPIPQLFASVVHFRLEVQPTQFSGLTDESLSEGSASLKNAVDVD